MWVQNKRSWIRYVSCQNRDECAGYFLYSGRLVQTCDRIQVIKDGKTRGEIQYEGISEASIMQTIAKE